MVKLMKRFVKEEEGLEFVEYALVALLIAVAAFALFQTLGQNVASAIQSTIGAFTGGGN